MSRVLNFDEGTTAGLVGERTHETNLGSRNFLKIPSHSRDETRVSNKLGLRKLQKYCYVTAALEILKKIKTSTWSFSVIISAIGLLSDPLLLYMPGINEIEVCIQFDKIFGIAACILLTVFDLHYIILKLHDGLRKGRRRYFILLFQVASILPISQVAVMIMIIQREGTMTVQVTLWVALYFSLLLKHLRRFFPVLKWSRKAITSGKLADWSLLFCFYNLYFSQGLQNLSSFGQNLDVGTDSLGNIYAILVIVFGILSFSFLIGMIQIYQQSFVKRIVAKEKKEKKLKKKFQETKQLLREAEQWLSLQNVSKDLRSQINKLYKHDNWPEIKVVNLDNMLNNLPKDLRCKLTRELCLKMLKEVVELERWSEASLEEFCDYVKPVLYAERTRIIREGDPIDEIIFVVQGKLWTYTSMGKTTDSPRTDCLNYTRRNGHMKRGDFFGEELVNWIHASPHSTDLPISTKTIQAVTNVEAFVLMAYDLKNIVIKHQAVIFVQLYWRFRRLRLRSNMHKPVPGIN